MTNKNKELAKKFLKENKLDVDAWLVTDHVTDQKGKVAAFSLFPFPTYSGRGHIVVADTIEEGKRIFMEAYPNSDWDIVEIDVFEGKIIVWD